MFLIAHGRSHFISARSTITAKIIRVMKLVTLFMLAAAFAVSAAGHAQQVTLSVKNAPLEKIFTEIRKQTGYEFLYTTQMLQGTRPVDIQVSHAPLEAVLKICFSDQPVGYTIRGNTIVITPADPALHKEEKPLPPPLIDIKGRITDEEGNGVIATITVKGTKNAVTSDNEGYYILKGVEENAILVISAVNIETVEIRVGSRTFINVPVKLQVKELDAPIVVAYNTTTQRSNVASLTVVKKEDFENIPVRSVDKALQGLVPGLLVTQGTGQPGGGLTNFIVRGISTLQDPFTDFATVRNPLIVIDGVPVTQDNYQWPAGVSRGTSIINPLAQLNVEDFESITVLKDAAAIALYGSKASNGVILLTTKKGKAGKTIVAFHNQTDITQRLKGKTEWVSQSEYLDLVIEALINYNPSSYPDESAVIDYLKGRFPTRSDGNFYPFTDWEDELYTKTAFSSVNNLSFSGGNDQANYYLNLGYTKQNGVIKNTGFDQKSIRFNIENRPVNWFKLGLNTGVSYNIQDYGASIGSNVGANPEDSPLNPVRLEDGTYFLNFVNPTRKPNPVAVNEYNTNRNKSYRAISKLSSEISFLRNFKFSSVLGVDYMQLEAKEVMAVGFYNTNTGSSDGMIRERNTRNWNLIATNQLSYNNHFGKGNSINVLLGQEAQTMNTKVLDATGMKIRLPGFDQISGTVSTSSTGLENKSTLLSWLGQANYGYKNRYFLSASVRADGSSNFGERNRFGTFWSTGLGWVVSEENFMKNFSWISYLKIRGSIGAAGNSFAIDRFTRYDILANGPFLNNLAVYPRQNGIPGNPDIQWERTFTWDAGLEATLLSSRIKITADIYQKETSNVVASISLPYVTGYQSVLDNIGSINNRGIELSFSLDIIKNRVFQWNLNANWSTNKNRLVSINNPLIYVGGSSSVPLVNLIGMPLNSFYMIRWAGVDPSTGAALWIDSTGKPNPTPSTANREIVGKPAPDGFGAISNSFTYKGIQLSALFYYQYGYQINNNFYLINDGNSPFQNQDKAALDRWQKPGDISPNPKRRQSTNSTTTSTRFLFNGDYIRLQTLTIGYTFPQKVLSRLRLDKLKVYAQAYNLAIWTKFPGNDLSNVTPTGGIGGQYPNGKSFSIGVDLNF